MTVPIGSNGGVAALNQRCWRRLGPIGSPPVGGCSRKDEEEASKIRHCRRRSGTGSHSAACPSGRAHSGKAFRTKNEIKDQSATCFVAPASWASLDFAHREAPGNPLRQRLAGEKTL